MPLTVFTACPVTVHYSCMWGGALQGTQYRTLLRPCRGARAPMGAEVITLEHIPCGLYVGRYGGAPALPIHAPLAPSHMRSPVHMRGRGRLQAPSALNADFLQCCPLRLTFLLELLMAFWPRTPAISSHLSRTLVMGTAFYVVAG